jgi:YjbE family integral membrane protein
MLDWLGPILGIVLVDLMLSGDNAVVIGAAAAALPARQRLIAIGVGGGGAIVLRIFFALAATRLLQLPYLGIVGGIILLVIAIRLLTDRNTILDHSKQKTAPTGGQCSTDTKNAVLESDSKGPLMSIFTILVADVMMSLDNVLAMAGLANGNLFLLSAGLALSITILLVGSALVAILIRRLSWLLDIACLVVGWTAVDIFLGDDRLQPFLQRFPWMNLVAYAAVTIIILMADVYFQKCPRKFNN